MARPNVGETVHYVSHGSANGRYPRTCRAALVTEVSDDRDNPLEIGLAVLNPTGIHFDRQVAHDPDEGPGTWHWACPANAARKPTP